MTESDRAEPHPGYWPSAWPVECGGNRRQKARAGRLDAASGRAEVLFRNAGRWNVMTIEREPGQWYLGGTMAATGSRIANGMFLSPGGDRDIFYCSTLGFARVVWG